MKDKEGRTIVAPPPEPWCQTCNRFLGYNSSCFVRLGRFTAFVEGHIGSSDWKWRVTAKQPDSVARFTQASGGFFFFSEEQARHAALAVLGTAIYVDNL